MNLWGLGSASFYLGITVCRKRTRYLFGYMARLTIQVDGIPDTAQLLTLPKNYLTYDPETGLENRKPIGAEITTYPLAGKHLILTFQFQVTPATNKRY